MSVNRTLYSVLSKYTRNWCCHSDIYARTIVTAAASNRNINALNSNQTRIANSVRYNVPPRSQHYTTALSNMTKDQANDLVFRLNDQERQVLYQVLQQFQANQERKRLEGELAASRWRSRFGRPATRPSLGDVDPTGSYCPVPEDWLHKKFVEQTPPPSSNDLFKLLVINSLPFIGFGFLDNFTMIIAGDYIEHSIGCVITISTMAAAGLGNTISDVLGIGSAYYVERAAEKVGVKPPELTPIQLEMPTARRAANFGRVLGITIGCLLGMCPLLFMDLKGDGDDKKEKELPKS